MYGIDEDAYWERRREEWENPRAFRRRSQWDDEEPVYESGYVFLDDEIGEIEQKRGFPMEELYEGDLLEILEELKGIRAETAKWDGQLLSIDYTVRVA